MCRGADYGVWSKEVEKLRVVFVMLTANTTRNKKQETRTENWARRFSFFRIGTGTKDVTPIWTMVAVLPRFCVAVQAQHVMLILMSFICFSRLFSLCNMFSFNLYAPRLLCLFFSNKENIYIYNSRPYKHVYCSQ